MHFAIVIGAASGSKFLRKNLSKQLRTYTYPDTWWYPYWFPYEGLKRKFPYNQVLDERGYKNFPTLKSIEGFKKRTGFTFNPKKTIEENFIDFCKWDYKKKNVLTYFNWAYMFKFFTNNPGLYDYLLFVIRHPLFRYLSLVDKKRHYSYTVPFGGPDTEGAIQYFAKDWNSLAEEALSHDNHYILRYEFLAEDLKKTPKECHKFFKGWSPRLWRKNILSPQIYNKFYDLVKDNFYKIYDDWTLDNKLPLPENHS